MRDNDGRLLCVVAQDLTGPGQHGGTARELQGDDKSGAATAGQEIVRVLPVARLGSGVGNGWKGAGRKSRGHGQMVAWNWPFKWLSASKVRSAPPAIADVPTLLITTRPRVARKPLAKYAATLLPV